jgi:predicted nucleic-acid-binding protein
VDDADAPRQCDQARELVKQAGQVRISLVVFVETLWVLNRSYRASRKEVAGIAYQLLDHPRYHVEAAALLRAAVDIFKQSNVDIADAIALADARSNHVLLHTFDSKLGKLDGVVAIR